MGDLLISGKGTDVSYGKDWAVAFGIALVVVISGITLAGRFGMQRATQPFAGIWYTPTDAFFQILLGSIVLAIVLLWYFARYIKKYKKTEIHVHENGIMGTGIGKGDFQVQSFNTGFDRVASVDTSKKVVITVNLYGSEYIVVAANAVDIAGIVNFKLQEQTAKKSNQTIKQSN